MTHITQLTSRTATFSSRTIPMALAGLLLVLVISSTAQAQWTTNGNNIYNTNTGNVGVGTSSPNFNFEVAMKASLFPAINIVPSTVYGQRATLSFGLNAALTQGWAMGQDRYATGTRDMYLYDVSHNRDVMYWGANGEVGIGTTSPSYKLDVNGDTNVTGDLNVTGSITAPHQDVAEWVPATGMLSAGTVVTLDPTKSNHVEASAKAYDTRVAGVVSAQPGIVLGKSGDHKVLVATTGRVRLKVDASNGPIVVGDLLVTSNIPGVAMKSQPIDVGGVQIHRPGTLIGKALEPLQQGKGEILVLLSLQ